MTFMPVRLAPPRLNRSQLFVLTTRPETFEASANSEADVILFELEDAVPPAEKSGARRNLLEALNDIDWGSKTLSMRINGLDTPYMYRDVVDVLEGPSERLDLLLIPKAGVAADVYAVDMLVTQIEQATGRSKRLGFEIMIETALGMANIDEIAGAKPAVGLQVEELPGGQIGPILRIPEVCFVRSQIAPCAIMKQQGIFIAELIDLGARKGITGELEGGAPEKTPDD